MWASRRGALGRAGRLLRERHGGHTKQRGTISCLPARGGASAGEGAGELGAACLPRTGMPPPSDLVRPPVVGARGPTRGASAAARGGRIIKGRAGSVAS